MGTAAKQQHMPLYVAGGTQEEKRYYSNIQWCAANNSLNGESQRDIHNRRHRNRTGHNSRKINGIIGAIHIQKHASDAPQKISKKQLA